MGLFSNDAGNDEIQAALNEIRRNTPTQAQLTLPELKQYVAAGYLSPEQYEAILANPDVYSDSIAANTDNTGSDAQKAALQQLSSIVNSGGSSAINDANLKNNLNQTNQAMQAARLGITNDAQQRNVSGGGLEFISKLMNEQSNAQNANMNATNAAADNSKLALQALTQSGQLGGQMQGQANQSAQAQAEAARQIAEYNSQLQSQANQYNTQQANAAQAGNLANAQDLGNKNTENANMRTQYNSLIPQQMFQNSVAGANASNVLGQQKSNQQAQQNALTGNLLGAAGTVVGGMYGGPMGAYAGNKVGKKIAGDPNEAGSFAQGGEVMRNQPQQAPQQGGGGHSGGIPKEALFALAGVMAAYPVLRHAFGNSAPDQTTLQQDMGSQHSPMGDDMNMCDGGMCYAQGGEVHDHRLCMEAGGPVPGDDSQMPPMQDDESQDVIPANLSPNEIVLPRSVAMAPDAPQQASNFVSQIKGQSAQPQMGATVNSFAEALAKLEENGLELRLASKGS